MNEPLDLSVDKETLLFLVMVGVVSAPLFASLRRAPVLGYLLAGVALGPYGLGSIGLKAPWLSALAIHVDAIDRIAAFGVVVLMFTMGLELSLERLRCMRHLVFGLGPRQSVATTLFLIAGAWGLGPARPRRSRPARRWRCPRPRSSSDAGGERRLHTGTGRASLSVLLFQDLWVALLLVMVAMLDRRPAGPGVAAAHDACAPAGRGDRDGRDRTPRPAAIRSNWSHAPKSRRALHGGVPAGGDRDGRRRCGGRPVDGARRLPRRRAAGGNRISGASSRPRSSRSRGSCSASSSSRSA